MRNPRARPGDRGACALLSPRGAVPAPVLAIESVVCPLVGVVFAASGWLGGTDVLSDGAAMFFCTGFSGLGPARRPPRAHLAGALARSPRRRSHERRSHAVGKHARKLAALALCVVVPDFVALALAASYTISIEAVWVCLFFYLLTGVFAACFFFKLVYDANVDVIALMRHRRGHIAEPVAHMIGWLGISGIFLCMQFTGFLLCVLSNPGTQAFAHSPAAHLVQAITIYLGRIGASYAQVRNLDPIGAAAAHSAAHIAPDKAAAAADPARPAARGRRRRRSQDRRRRRVGDDPRRQHATSHLGGVAVARRRALLARPARAGLAAATGRGRDG